MIFDSVSVEIVCDRKSGESEKTVWEIGELLDGESVGIEDYDELDVALEQRRLVIAVAALLTGSVNAEGESSEVVVREQTAFAEKIAGSSISLLAKKQIERMMSILPEMDEILELMEDMEYEYWGFFVKIIKNVLKADNFAESERKYFEKLLAECDKRDKILTEICWHSSFFVSSNKQ